MLPQFGAGGTTCCCSTFEFTHRLFIRRVELVGSRSWPRFEEKAALEFLELGGGSSKLPFSWKLEHGVDVMKWLAGCL